MAVEVDKKRIEQVCKDIIETILFCLPNAFKGTVYRISTPPELIAKRITSGIINEDRKTISWGLPEKSEYNPPGKPWLKYRDEPGRPLEAMSWCVENQKSWTAENPAEDERSVRRQVEGISDDYYHMEPVLIRKEDLYGGDINGFEYPRSYEDDILWKNSDYVVVDVIKIHFRPNTLKLDSAETRLINKLSSAFGTELLSHQLRQQSVEAMHRLAEDRLDSCNILADSLRNAIAKSGIIFSLLKLELGALRQQWEEVLLERSDLKRLRHDGVRMLNKALKNIDRIPDDLREKLHETQNKFLGLFLPPEMGENWIQMKVEERWNELVSKYPLDETHVEEIRKGISQLKKSLYLGRDPEILATYDKASESLKAEWADLIYKDVDHVDSDFFDRLILILEDPSLHLPYQKKSKKSLILLKALAETMSHLENNTNQVLHEMLNGSD
ncbi:MAG: hypothetical protein GY864_14235 [Desulfobacterales bacterium]|nr:hypothetical protein [Desulfobacterales bacterium]